MVTLEEVSAAANDAASLAASAELAANNADARAMAAQTAAEAAESAANAASADAQVARQAAEDALEGRVPFLPNGADTFVISQPGSYVLVGNVTMSDPNTTCIQVSAEDVTIDLNGHTISGPGTAGTSQGIDQTAGSRLRVFNGTVRDFGSIGILPRSEAWIHDVRFRGGSAGIVLSSAPRCLIERCSVSGTLNSGVDFSDSGGSVLRDCLVHANSMRGMAIFSSNDCRIANTTFEGNGGVGGVAILDPSSGSVVEGNEFINHSTSTGLSVGGSGHIVVGNIARGNSTDYSGVDANTIHDLSVETTPPPGYANIQP
jgi:parallel beta-helix repeat protein